MATPDLDLLKKSVTAGDVATVVGNGVVRVVVPLDLWGNLWGQDQISLPPVAPPFWTRDRDTVLRATVYKEAMWASAIGIAISKVTASGWEIQADVTLRASRAQTVYLNADGSSVGWVSFLAKHLRSFLTTDNGAFVEIVRARKGIGSKIIGIRHLDPMRCTRTGDPRIPVLYRDRKGRYHELQDYQVMLFSDMPDDSETYFGVGLCAASRAYSAIYKLASIEWFLREKVGGLHPLAIYIVNGLLTNQMNDAVRAAKEETLSKGAVSYMGAVIMGIPQGETPGLVTIPLAELPDGFNRKEEFDLSILTYADAIGLDVQDLQPLTGQSLGSGAQSRVLEEKSKGKGLSAWKQQWIHQNNEKVLPRATVFAFTERDYGDMLKKAEVSLKRAEVAKSHIEAAITTPAQELQVLVDADELPREFLPIDETQSDTLSDVEKPIGEEMGQAQAETQTAEQAQNEEKTFKAFTDESETLAARIATMPEYLRLAIEESETELKALTKSNRAQVTTALASIPETAWQEAETLDAQTDEAL